MAALLSMIFNSAIHNLSRARTANAAACICAAAVLAAVWHNEARAEVTPDSPEVQKLVDLALNYLESHEDGRLGGKCLIGLAFIKAGRSDHSRVREAIDACVAEMKNNPNESTLD